MDEDTIQRLRSDPVAEQLRRTLRAAASLLEVARVSVWAYGETGEGLYCLAQHDPAAGRERRTPGRIGREEYPAYFRALRRFPRIAAGDVYGDRRLREFRRPYATELGVRSWLDLPLERGGSSLGRLRVEHVGPVRDWNDDELALAGCLAELLSLLLSSERSRRRQETPSEPGTLRARDSTLFRDNPAALAVVDLPDTILDCNAASGGSSATPRPTGTCSSRCGGAGRPPTWRPGSAPRRERPGGSFSTLPSCRWGPGTHGRSRQTGA